MLDSVLNSIPQAVYWKDRESKYIGCNDLFARTVGIDRKEDVTGKTDIDLPWTAGHAHAYRADDREVIESKKPKNHIIESAVLADGSHIWVDTSTIPLVNDIGQVEGVIGIYDDVTERKMAEENLSRSERNYREIFNATGDALLILDETGRIHDVNQQMCKMFGCDRETALLTNVKDLSSEESQSSHNGTHNDFSGAAKHAHQICQWKCRRFSGELFWTEVVRHASVISGDMRIIVSMRDITERKQAVEALHREKKFTQAILENMVDGVVVCDQEGKLVLFNKTARLWHGLDPSKIPQEQWARHYDLYFSDGITPMSAATVPLARAFRGEVLQDAGMVILAKGKPALHILTNCAPFFDEQGRLLGAVAVMHDITERKKGEEALKKSQRLLSETEKMGKVGGWELNIDTGKQTWTEELYEIHEVALDYQPTLEGGIKFYSITSLPVIRQAIQRAIEQGEPFDLELEIITAKGNLRHVHAIGQPDLYQRRIYGFFQDISERKHAEEEILMLAHSLKSVNECVSITDEENRILFVNKAFLNTYGYEEDELNGKTIDFLRAAENYPGIYEEISQATINGGWKGELKNRRKDGSDQV
jgi:PAS domain S-box-containing protein